MSSRNRIVSFLLRLIKNRCGCCIPLDIGCISLFELISWWFIELTGRWVIEIIIFRFQWRSIEEAFLTWALPWRSVEKAFLPCAGPCRGSAKVALRARAGSWTWSITSGISRLVVIGRESYHSIRRWFCLFPFSFKRLWIVQDIDNLSSYSSDFSSFFHAIVLVIKFAEHSKLILLIL